MQKKGRINQIIVLISTVTILNSCQEKRKADMNNDGGISFVLEASAPDIIHLCGVSKNDTLINNLLINTTKIKKTSEESFAKIFVTEFYKNNKENSLASHFKSDDLKENASADDCLKFILHKTDETTEKLKQILLQRLNKLDIENPTVQSLGNDGRILVQLPGIKQNERFHELLQASANIEFWETFDNKEIYPFLEKANTRLKEILNPNDNVAKTKKIIKADSSMSLSEQLAIGKSTTNVSVETIKKENPLFTVLSPSIGHDEKGKTMLGKGPVVGYALIKDTAIINTYFNNPQIKFILPRDLKFLWTFKPIDTEGTTLELMAIRIKSTNGEATLSGNFITGAKKVIDKHDSFTQISLNMTPEAAVIWQYMTRENIGKSLAIVVDNKVYSFPKVQGEIKGGISSITGNFTIEEADDLVTIFNAGKLPVRLTVIQEKLIAPLGNH